MSRMPQHTRLAGSHTFSTRRGSDTRLATGVATVVPTLAATARARLSGVQDRKKHIYTTFCPACGGNKVLRARYCESCWDDARRTIDEAYAKPGHGSIPKAEQLLIRRVAARNSRADQVEQRVVVQSGWHTRGEGRVRLRQPVYVCAQCPYPAECHLYAMRPHHSWDESVQHRFAARVVGSATLLTAGPVGKGVPGGAGVDWVMDRFGTGGSMQDQTEFIRDHESDHTSVLQ